MHSNRRMSLSKVLVSLALACGLVLSLTPAAIAEESTPRSVEEITEEMNRLYMEAEQSQYDLISANTHVEKMTELIAELDTQIEQASKDLDLAKVQLSQFVSDDYKQGGISLLDIIFSSSSFDDFISQIIYANKITEHKQAVIEKVDSLYSTLTLKKSELEKAKADQELYIAQQQESTVAAEEASQAAIAFIDQLPNDVVEQLASADAEQREAAVQASMQALQNMDEGQLEALAASVGASTSDTSSGGSTSTASSSSSSSSYSDLMSRLYSILGSGYQWSGYNYTGDNSSSSFTCSGVVDYALGRSSQSSSPETLYEEVGSNMTTDVSQLQEGDLVFYSYGGREVGHVGVYVGNGQIIDSIPNGGVAVRDVNYMNVVGGGSL